MMTTCEPLIDSNRAAEIIGVHPKTIKRMAQNGELPAMKIGRLWKFRESALDEWLRTELTSSCHPCPRKEGDE